MLAPFLTAATLWSLAWPGWHLTATRVCLAAWMGLGVVCAVGIVRRTRARDGHPVPLWMLMVVPVLAVLVVVAAITEAPVQLRVRMHLTGMTSSAQTYLNDFGAALPDEIGPFPVEQVTRRADGVYYVVGGGGSDDAYGLVYRPGGAPGETVRDRFVHLEGDWYLWYANSPRRLFR